MASRFFAGCINTTEWHVELRNGEDVIQAYRFPHKEFEYALEFANRYNEKRPNGQGLLAVGPFKFLEPKRVFLEYRTE